MTAMARSVPRKKPAQAQMMSDGAQAMLKRRFRIVMAVCTACFFVAFGGIFAQVNMHQPWGIPLFALAMIVGFGSQIAFIVGLVKASRLEKGV